MAKIFIELEINEWYDIEWALRIAEISEMNLAERAEPFLESAQREKIEEIIKRHNENVEKYKKLQTEIIRQERLEFERLGRLGVRIGDYSVDDSDVPF